MSAIQRIVGWGSGARREGKKVIESDGTALTPPYHMKRLPSITEAEWRVMRVVWQKGPCVAHEVSVFLLADRGWKPATVKTFLNRLTRKGALCFSKHGRSYVYSSTFSECDFRLAETDSFCERVFDGSALSMVSFLMKTNNLSVSDLNSCRKGVINRKV